MVNGGMMLSVISYVEILSPHLCHALAAQSLPRHALSVHGQMSDCRIGRIIGRSICRLGDLEIVVVELVSRGTQASCGRCPKLWRGERHRNLARCVHTDSILWRGVCPGVVCPGCLCTIDWSTDTCTRIVNAHTCVIAFCTRVGLRGERIAWVMLSSSFLL